jgi:hypothetical protein
MICMARSIDGMMSLNFHYRGIKSPSMYESTRFTIHDIDIFNSSLKHLIYEMGHSALVVTITASTSM